VFLDGVLTTNKNACTCIIISRSGKPRRCAYPYLTATRALKLEAQQGKYVEVERVHHLPILQRKDLDPPYLHHIAVSILVGSGLKENAPQLHCQPQIQVRSDNKYDGKKMCY
jgi:hypothetical protein